MIRPARPYLVAPIRFQRAVGAVWGRFLGALCLVTLALGAQAAGPKAGQADRVPVADAPVARLIILYRDTGEDSRAGSLRRSADEPVVAADRVARSAVVAGHSGMRYLKSVSPRMHVARLDRAVSPAEAQVLIQRLQADPDVASVTVDMLLQPHSSGIDITDTYVTTPADRYYQWHLQNPILVAGGMNATSAWSSATGTGVTVAVLDGGYRPHADLVGNLLTSSGYDFISNAWIANDGDANPVDDRDGDASDPGDWVTASDPSKPADCSADDSSWHGTHVAGLVAATANGSEGVGVAPGSRVLPVRVLGRCGGYMSDILAGARWAAGLSVDRVTSTTTPAKVLNLSLGVKGTCDSSTQAVIDEIRARGVSVVASAGNDGLTRISTPGNCVGVVAVTAHRRSGGSASYANVGSGVAISAPGGDSLDAVASTWNGGTTTPGGDQYGLMSGTSMAAPQVAGVLALMASVRPDLAQASLESLMRGAARAFPPGTYCITNPDQLAPGFCGSGLLDAGQAVAAAQAAPSGAADLAVLQRASAASWTAGSTVILSIQLRNWGVATATASTLNVALSGMEILSVSTGGLSESHTASSLSVTVGSLASNGEKTVTVTARITAADGVVSTTANASTAATEVTLTNNNHRLDPSGTVSATSTTGTASSGGGCTSAPDGQADLGLPLLLGTALLALLWRRRSARTARI